MNKIFGDENTKKMKALEPLVTAINSFEATISSLTDEQLKAKTLIFALSIFHALLSIFTVSPSY